MGLFGGITKAIGSVAEPVVGAVGGILGSNSANKAASAAESTQLDFEKQQYEDWKAVYGPVQDNLGAYYSNLTPDYYETIGLENFQLERNAAIDQLNTYLARNGIEDSGVALQLRAGADLNAAAERAKIRREAPQQARQDQMNFLSIGMNANPAPSVSNTLGQQAAGARARANDAAASAGEATGKAVSAVGSLVQTGLSSYFGE